MAHTVTKRFLADVAYTEREFQVAHTAFGNQANFDYELNDLNTRLFKVLSGNAIINGYFYEFEESLLMTLPVHYGILYITLTVNKATGQTSFSIQEKILPGEDLFDYNVILFAVEMTLDKIVNVARTTQEGLLSLFDEYRARDFVIESGENYLGVKYEKWKNGKLKMWGQADLTPIKDKVVSTRIEYPEPFAKNDYASFVTARTAGPNDVQVSVANNVNHLVVYLYRNSNIQTGVNWSAEGVWKE